MDRPTTVQSEVQREQRPSPTFIAETLEAPVAATNCGGKFKKSTDIREGRQAASSLSAGGVVLVVPCDNNSSSSSNDSGGSESEDECCSEGDDCPPPTFSMSPSKHAFSRPVSAREESMYGSPEAGADDADRPGEEALMSAKHPTTSSTPSASTSTADTTSAVGRNGICVGGMGDRRVDNESVYIGPSCSFGNASPRLPPSPHPQQCQPIQHAAAAAAAAAAAGGTPSSVSHRDHPLPSGPSCHPSILSVDVAGIPDEGGAGGCKNISNKDAVAAAAATTPKVDGRSGNDSFYQLMQEAAAAAAADPPSLTASTQPSAAHLLPPAGPADSPPLTPSSVDVTGVIPSGREHAAAAAAAHNIDGRNKNACSASKLSGGDGGSFIDNTTSSRDGRVRVLCRFRRPSDRECGGRRSSSSLSSLRYGGGDWLNFRGGTSTVRGGGIGGGGDDREGGSESATPDTVSVRMGGVWSRRAFDKVLEPGAEQVQVYSEVKRVAHGVSQGFNGTIFAYGQTGSGKTYTMGGSADMLSFTPAATAAAAAAAADTPPTTIAPAGGAAGENRSPCSSGSSSSSCVLPAASVSSPTATTTLVSVSPATLRMPPPPPLSHLQQQQQQGGQQPAPSPKTPSSCLPGASASERESATGGGCLGAEAGVIPRAVSTVLADAETRRSQGWEFVLTATYVEIYNEKIRDLLNPSNDNLQVKEYSSGVQAAGATEVRVSTLEEAVAVLKKGADHRATAATLMNSASSRSHSIFMLRLDQRDVVRDCKVSARLTLVDLAGSERAGKTGVEGKRREEANSINVSLHTLGRVIRTLSENGPHVPFRDSKLTRLLQESLGGNSRTVLIICCSPEEAQAQETLSTLKFGECAKRVTTFASANVVAAPDEVAAQLAELRAEVVRLKRQLLDCQLREVRRNEAMMSLGGRRSSRSSMGAAERASTGGGGGGGSGPVGRKWGASPLTHRPASFCNTLSCASDMVNSSGDESWPAVVNNSRGGGVWEPSVTSWTRGEGRAIASAPSPSSPGGQKPAPLPQAHPQSQLTALVLPTTSPDVDHHSHHAGLPLSRSSSGRGQQQFGRRRRQQQLEEQEQQHQHQQPRRGSALRTAPRTTIAAAASIGKQNTSGGGGGRLERTGSGYSSTRSDASARRLWLRDDDGGGSTTDTAAAAAAAAARCARSRRRNNNIGPAAAAAAASTPAGTGGAKAPAAVVGKVTPATSSGDGVSRYRSRRRSWSGTRISWSKERLAQPFLLASSTGKGGGAEGGTAVSETTRTTTTAATKRPTLPLTPRSKSWSSPTKAAASGRQYVEGDEVMRGPGPDGSVSDEDAITAASETMGDFRKAADGGRATAAAARGSVSSLSSCSGDDGEAEKDIEPRKIQRSVLARVQGLKKKWTERAEEYETLLQLKDLRIESLMLLHERGPVSTGGRSGGVVEGVAASTGRNAAAAAAAACAASTTPTKIRGSRLTSTPSGKAAGSSGRQYRRSSRERRSPRSAAAGRAQRSPPPPCGGNSGGGGGGGSGGAVTEDSDGARAAAPPGAWERSPRQDAGGHEGGGAPKTRTEAFPMAPPPSPMPSNVHQRCFTLDDTDTEGRDY